MLPTNIDYLCKNVYFLNDFSEYSSRIPVHLANKKIPACLHSDLLGLLDDKFFEVVDYKEDMYTIQIDFDKSIIADGYSLKIGNNRVISIVVSQARGLRYAFRLLNDSVSLSEGKYLLPIILIEDEPAFFSRGIIEGYYGEPWTLSERIDMFDFMDKVRLNTYMYAPKSDVYHREKWFELYPEDKFCELIQLKARADNFLIDFCYCISPGHAVPPEIGFDYSSEKDFERLYRKLDQLIDLGITQFGLLLDDIDYKLSPENIARFLRPGIAHAHICNKVFTYLRCQIEKLKFVMCPTEYHQIGDTEYRTDLKNHLLQDIAVFWTGDNVCSEAITSRDAFLTKRAYQKDMYIWDNFPVSDFTYGVREFIAPIRNRASDLGKFATGYMINPSINYHISKVAMITMAHYCWNTEKYNPEISFAIALKSVGEDFYEASLAYIEYNYPSVLSFGRLWWEKDLVNRDAYPEIKAYFKKTVHSVKKMLKLKYPIIDELRPWLKRAIQEEVIVNKILDDKIDKEELVSFLSNIKFSGSELLDYLLLKRKLLTESEFDTLIKKRRGPQWYRVFEEKK